MTHFPLPGPEVVEPYDLYTAPVKVHGAQLDAAVCTAPTPTRPLVSNTPSDPAKKDRAHGEHHATPKSGVDRAPNESAVCSDEMKLLNVRLYPV